MFRYAIFIRMDLPRETLSILDASEPLRKRAPTVDEHGNPVTDFMVIIPGLRKKPKLHIQQTLDELHRVLASFSGIVVFAEFNLALNLLWVSTRQGNGMRDEIAMAIRSSIPAARLVSHI